MKTYTTTEIQDRLAERLAATRISETKTYAGTWWGRGESAERFYFGASAEITKHGKPIRGIRVWLQFDDPATLDGASLRVEAPSHWIRQLLADKHAGAIIIAVELVDPAEGARLRAELDRALDEDEPVGDLVGSDED